MSPIKSRRELLEALDQLVQAVARAPGSDEAQALIAGLEAGGEGVLGELIAHCRRLGDAVAADFLALGAVLANDLEAREEAKAALTDLEKRAVVAGSPFLSPLRQKKYLSGWVASAGQGQGHRLLTLWRRERGLAQAYLFGLDAEGGLIGFEASRNLSPSQVEEMVRSGGVKVSRQQAAGLVRRGLDVARAKGLGLPEEFLRQHRFVEESVFGI